MQKNIRQILSKIGKYSILLSIKESYLLSKNLLGLIVHPFKTIRSILRERDYSQVALIFGLPFYIFITGFVFIFGARFLISAPTQWGILAKALVFLVSLTSLLIFIYLVYWLFKVKSQRSLSIDDLFIKKENKK
ncbi:hypothetical protein ACFLZ1_00395 [Patescibacteria group bacterium]